MVATVGQISVVELAQRLRSPGAPLVLDVREGWERDIARLPDTLDIPMGEVPQRLAELPRDRAIAVLCRSGGRSQQVADFLVAQGLAPVLNIAGGILAWGREVDPSIRPY